MRKIKKIIIHCSDTPKTLDIGVKTIREWHKERGWKDVGYHYVITRSGHIEVGRELDVIGAHCLHHNRNSIGICWVGGIDNEDNRTPEQVLALHRLVGHLLFLFPLAKVHGHNEFSTKYCPSFDVKKEFHDTQIELFI